MTIDSITDSSVASHKYNIWTRHLSEIDVTVRVRDGETPLRQIYLCKFKEAQGIFCPRNIRPPHDLFQASGE